MLGYVILGTLAAFGLFSVLWALLGWLLPGGRGCAVVCYGMPDEEILARSRWLRGAGLLNCPLLVVTEETGLSCDEAEICTGEQLLPRLEWERKRFDGTGTGDHTGRGQRRDISEL